MKIEDMPRDPLRTDKHINPETGIWPMSEWGSECTRGFVSDSRFGSNQTVIKRTNRSKTRQAYRRFGGASNERVLLKMQWPSMDQLKMAWGYLLLIIVAFLIIRIALGKVEQETSWGLTDALHILGVLAGGYVCVWEQQQGRTSKR